MFGDRMVGSHVDHRACDRRRSQRVVRWRLDDHVAADDRVAHDAHGGNVRNVAGDDMHRPRTERARPGMAAGLELHANPAVEIRNTYRLVRGLMDDAAGEALTQGLVDALENLR